LKTFVNYTQNTFEYTTKIALLVIMHRTYTYVHETLGTKERIHNKRILRT